MSRTLALAAGDLMAIAEEAGAARLGENVVQCTREDLARIVAALHDAEAVFARTSPASLTEREQYIWTLGYTAGAGQSDGEPHASGSLPPLPTPTEMWTTHDSTGRAVPAYGYTQHQMYEYARQSVYLVDENLLGFAQWLLDAYHSDEGMPEAKEIAKEARAAIAVATGEQQ